MREIKFRIWDISRKKMNYPEQEKYEATDKHPNHAAGYYLLNLKGTILCNDGIVLDDWHESYIAMQYTGLKDKNGKDIYDGDILFGREEGDGETTAWTNVYCIVFYDDKSASFKIREPNIKEDSVWCDSVSDVNKEYEVVGNIYQNSKLLKK